MHLLHLLQNRKATKSQLAEILNPIGLGLVLLAGILTSSGCSTPGPIGSTDFDPTFRQTVQAGEQLLFYSRTELHEGTYMEGEMRAHQSREGVLLLTDKRMVFAQWNDMIERYTTYRWNHYFDIWRMKKHNNTLLQYVAIITKDGAKNTYFLSTENTEKAHKIIIEQGQIQYRKNQHQGIKPKYIRDRKPAQ